MAENIQNDIGDAMYGGGMAGLDALLRQIMGGYGQMTSGSLQPLSPSDAAMLQGQYTDTVTSQSELLRKKLLEQLGNLASNAATRGITGSSAQGRAVGTAMSGHQDALSQILMQAKNNQIQQALGLRQAGAQIGAQNYGTLAQMAQALMGQRFQGYNTIAGIDQATQQAQANRYNAVFQGLGGIGQGLGWMIPKIGEKQGWWNG